MLDAILMGMKAGLRKFALVSLVKGPRKVLMSFLAVLLQKMALFSLLSIISSPSCMPSSSLMFCVFEASKCKYISETNVQNIPKIVAMKKKVVRRMTFVTKFKPWT